MPSELNELLEEVSRRSWKEPDKFTENFDTVLKIMRQKAVTESYALIY
jgi:hypothetical protein